MFWTKDSCFFMGVLVLFVLPFSVLGLSVDDHWEKFKLEYGRTYDFDSNRESLRKEIFAENLRGIEEHNQRYLRGLETYYKGVNEFTDLTWEEFRADKKCTAKHMLESSFEELEPFPEELDSFEDGDLLMINKGK